MILSETGNLKEFPDGFTHVEHKSSSKQSSRPQRNHCQTGGKAPGGPWEEWERGLFGAWSMRTGTFIVGSLRHYMPQGVQCYS